MKPTYNKSRVMTIAWRIYKRGGNNPYCRTFSAALSRAWYVEKETARYEAEQVAREAARAERLEREKAIAARRASMTEAERRAEEDARQESRDCWCNEYYNGTGSRGRYFGD